MNSGSQSNTAEGLYGKIYPLSIGDYDTKKDTTLIPFSLIDSEYASDHRAFHIDDWWPGYWGFMNNNHEVVIKPQFAFVYLFEKNRAIVAKGKFEYREDWRRDKSFNEDKLYKGFWTDEEKWGVIDGSGKEIIPCIYDYIAEITSEWSKSLDHRIVRAIRNEYQEAALFNMDTGETILDFGKYSDFGWPDGVDEYGQVLVATGGSLEHSDNIKVGILDVNNLEEIIKPQYDYVEIEGYHLYHAGELNQDGNENSGVMINHRNEKLIDRNDALSVSDFGLRKNMIRIRFSDQSESIFKIIKDEEGSPIEMRVVK